MVAVSMKGEVARDQNKFRVQEIKSETKKKTNHYENSDEEE